MNLDLDRKVLGRDSVFVAEQNGELNGELNGWFSKLRKKVRKVTRKIGRAVVPKKIYRSLSKFESKHRKNIKKVGAVAAVSVGGYFGGAKILSFIKSSGGKMLASSASKKMGKAVLKHQISKRMNAAQQRDIRKRARRMTAAQVLQIPEVQAVSMEIAAEDALQIHGNIGRTEKKANSILAKEGSIEVGHQTAKATEKNPWVKFAIPAAMIVTALINK